MTLCGSLDLDSLLLSTSLVVVIVVVPVVVSTFSFPMEEAPAAAWSASSPRMSMLLLSFPSPLLEPVRTDDPVNSMGDESERVEGTLLVYMASHPTQLILRFCCCCCEKEE